MDFAKTIASPSPALVAEALVEAGNVWAIAVFDFAAIADEDPALRAQLGPDLWSAIERELLAAEARLGVTL